MHTLCQRCVRDVEIAEVAHISAKTVQTTYRLLVKDASSIVPRDFADEGQVSRLAAEAS